MERELYGVEQAHHGHLYRWIFTREGLAEWDIEPFSGETEDIGFPIGGSNSSATYMVRLNTEEEVKNFLLADYDTDYEDPMLVDIAEGIYTIDTDDEYHGAITSEFVKLFGISADELTSDNSLYATACELIDAIREYDIDKCSGIDYENPFYGESRDMRLSELEEILEKFKLEAETTTEHVEIKLTEKQAVLVEKMCDSELHYKIHESGCSHEYADEINALLLIMKSLNQNKYVKYKKEFQIARREDSE